MKNLTMRVALGLILLMSVIGFFGIHNTSTVSAAGSLPGWANRIQLTIDHTKVPSALTNFPVMVHLSAASGINNVNVSSIFTSVGNFNKIAVTAADGTTQLYTEVEQWNNATKQAYLWVKVPNLSNTADTVLYLYYDNNQADNTAYVGTPGSAVSQNVWDPNYVGVYHMGEQGSGTSGEIKDSSSKAHNGTAMSDTGGAKPAAIQTPLGLGQAFNGGANSNYNKRNYIMVPDNNDFSISTTSKLTFSFWYNANVTLKWPDNNTGGDYVHTIGKGRTGGRWEWDFGVGLQGSSNKNLGLMAYEFNQTGGLGDGVGLGPYYTAPSSNPEWGQSYKVGDWLYIYGTYDNAAKTMSLTVYYCDGSQKLIVKSSRTNTGWSYLSSPGNTSEALYIGSVPNQYFDGIIDEFRISNNVRSSAWEETSFNSECDNLITYSASSSTPTQPPPVTTTPPATTTAPPPATTTRPPITMTPVVPEPTTSVPAGPISVPTSGGGVVMASASSGTTFLGGFMSTPGVFSKDASIKSDDSLLTLSIPQGTTGQTKDSVPMRSISATYMSLSQLPGTPDDGTVIGLPYFLGPEGSTFNPAIDITLNYDQTKIPAGIDENNLVFAYWDTAASKWVTLDSTVDADKDTVKASISHFSTYAVLGIDTPPALEIATSPLPSLSTMTAAAPTMAPDPTPEQATPTQEIQTEVPSPTLAAAIGGAPLNIPLIIGVIAAVVVIAGIIGIIYKRKQN